VVLFFGQSADDFAHAGQAQVDAVPPRGIELQMNSSAHTFADGKRQRIELEVGLAETPDDELRRAPL